MESHYMQGLDWVILGIYFAVLIAIGLWASSKRKKGGSLFLAEHSLRWHHIGFSMWGTNVGPSMLIASASAGFTTGSWTSKTASALPCILSDLPTA